MYWGVGIAWCGASQLVGSTAKLANQACQSHCIKVHVSQPGAVGSVYPCNAHSLAIFFQRGTRDFVSEKFPDERLES